MTPHAALKIPEFADRKRFLKKDLFFQQCLRIKHYTGRIKECRVIKKLKALPIILIVKYFDWKFWAALLDFYVKK